ncbi:sn-glycerol-3-phosphate ABC transporter ATP-binding protein UgpC [Saccharomonospora sp. NPDC046836]|uniref:ABC transporter ATP-binding protein n=1 Tax=Saccharomonospora sp. NPDC046836 TaxID=3156921 RepID=UPI003410A017
MAGVSYESASCIYPGTPPVRAVDSLDLSVPDGEFLVLVGPSGSGKSTALRMLAGLEDVCEGAIRIDDNDVSQLAPKDRDIAMVFQNYALYPHMTVAQNMGFALKIQRIPKDEIRSKVEDAAAMLDLTRYLDRRPKALSGGQRQRVAMGRAIVRNPSVFLMDEPLSNLDAKLRVETRANISDLQRRLGTTTIYVTHDQIEAMTMGTRVAVLRDGTLQQCAPPRHLYDRPANTFVAGFIGSPAMNLYTSTLTPTGTDIAGHTIALSREQLATAAENNVTDIVVGLRPEALRIVAPEQGGIPLVVELSEELGSDSYVYGRVEHRGGAHRTVVRTHSDIRPTIGETIHITPTHPDTAHIFDAATGQRIEVAHEPVAHGALA